MVNNKAAWIPEPHGQLVILDAPDPEVGEKDVLIETKAVAINSGEWALDKYISVHPKSYCSGSRLEDARFRCVGQRLSFDGFNEVPDTEILGEEVSGIVSKVGSSVTTVKPGDRVCGHCFNISSLDPTHAAFQKYTVVLDLLVAPIPDEISFERAAVIPLGLSTAAAQLYMKGCLPLPYSKLGTPEPTDSTVIIWGGSSSVECNAVQLAIASGAQVIATCSRKNFDYVKSLGANHVVDYTDSTVLDEIVSLMKGRKLAGILDCITEDTTLQACGTLATKLGGGLIVVTVVQPPEDLNFGAEVKFKGSFAVDIGHKEPEVAHAIYRDFLPEALRTGQFKPSPEPEVVGHGLEFIQEGIDRARKGVSAVKLVITL